MNLEVMKKRNAGDGVRFCCSMYRTLLSCPALSCGVLHRSAGLLHGAVHHGVPQCTADGTALFCPVPCRPRLYVFVVVLCYFSPLVIFQMNPRLALFDYFLFEDLDHDGHMSQLFFLFLVPHPSHGI